MKKGSIHSDERCPACGARFVSQEPRGLFCPEHPKISPHRYKVYFENITRRFNDYQTAFQFLTGLRFQAASDTFDSRDFQVKGKPLSFVTLADSWLQIKKKTLRHSSYTSYVGYMRYAVDEFGAKNIKQIDYGQLEDFIYSLPKADKTKFNVLVILKQFWRWCVKRHGIPDIKEWPTVRYEMAFRNTVSLETQELILTEVKRSSSFRVWLGIKWLCTYISVRPGELITLTERQVDRERGLLIIPHPKERKPKVVPLTEEDIQLVHSMPVSLPDLKFFRNDGTDAHGLCRPGEPFGPDRLYRVWKRACKALGIEGVDLYGGSKHSTAQALRGMATFEEVRTMTGHASNKAFERYYRVEGDAMKDLYSRRSKIIEASADKRLTTENTSSSKAQIIKLTK